MANIFISVINAAEERRQQERERDRERERERNAAHFLGGPPRADQAEGAGGSLLTGQEETELAKLRALIKEEQLARPPPPDAEVEALIKAVFADHLLAANPDFEKYFLAYKQQPASDPSAVSPPRPHRSLLTSNAVHPEPSPPPDLATSPKTSKLTSASPTTTTTTANSSWWARYLSSPTRGHVYSLLSYPDYSPAAFAVGMLLLCVVVLNTATFILESVPAYESTPLYNRLVIVDYVCLGVFTVELLLRLATCPSLCAFALDPMNWVDVAAVLPSYIELMVVGPGGSDASQTRIVRLVRLLRLMRLLRATTRFQNLQLVLDSLAASTDVLAMLAALLLVLLVVSATVLYFTENALVEGSWFDSIPATMYYMHVTLTTTGYGDLYPSSAWGKFIAGVFMLLCMVTLSLPISVIGGNFSSLWGRYNTLRDGLGRSAGAWGVARRLGGVAAAQCGALEDLMGAVTRVMCDMEDGTEDANPSGSGSGRLGAVAAGGADKAHADGISHAGVDASGRSGRSGSGNLAGWGGGDGDSGSQGRGRGRGRGAVAGRGVKGMADELEDLRAELRGEGGQDPSVRATVRARAAALRQELAAVREQQGQLQVLVSLCSRVVNRDMTDKLDRLDKLRKDVAGWAAEGAGTAAQAAALLGDLAACREVVGEAGQGEGEGQEHSGV